jgi:hypothetical protein
VRGKGGKTALILATIHEHESIVRRLLSHVNIDTSYYTWFRANRNASGNYNTAVAIAKKVGNVAIVTMLNDHEAKKEVLSPPAGQLKMTSEPAPLDENADATGWPQWSYDVGDTKEHSPEGSFDYEFSLPVPADDLGKLDADPDITAW